MTDAMTAAVGERVRQWSAVSLLLILPALAMASPVLDEGENAYFEHMPVVLTASRLPQSLQDAPGAMTVIDRSIIERSGYRDLARLLRLVPGMLVGQERGNASWVSYHGLGQSIPGELQVLIDGAPTYVPVSFGTTAWSGRRSSSAKSNASRWCAAPVATAMAPVRCKAR